MVHDMTAPVLDGMPHDLVVEVIGPVHTSVQFDPPAAHDFVDPSPMVSCLPASNSSFSYGSTIVTCTAADDAGNLQSASFEVLVRDSRGPRVIDVQLKRAGRQIDAIALSFDEALDPSSAESLSNFSVIRTRRARPIALNSISYDLSQHTVTVRPKKRLDRGESFRVMVKDGVTDAVNNQLDGNSDGQPGGEFVVQVGLYRRFSYHDRDGDRVQLAIVPMRGRASGRASGPKLQGVFELIQDQGGEGRWLRVHDLNTNREALDGAVLPSKDGSSGGRTTLQTITGLSTAENSLPLCGDGQDRKCFDVQAINATVVDEVLRDVDAIRI
jgi:hypothetical protein